MKYRSLDQNEAQDALNLVKEVFFQEGNLSLSKIGAKSFLEYLSMHGESLSYFGAYQGDLRAVIGYKPDTYHIALFFVRHEEQRQGIGSSLFKEYLKLAEEAEIGKISVNALDKAKTFYEMLGFEATGSATKKDDITTIPMEYLLGKEYLGKKVHVTVEKSYGSLHPMYPDTYVTANTGYVDELADRGLFIDAYIVGEEEALDTYEGYVIAMVYRLDSHQKKFVVSKSTTYQKENVIDAIAFEEQYFDTRIIWL